MSAFNRLLNQIDSFIRKFYKNQIIKGLLLFVGVFLVSFLVVVILEYFGRFNSLMRAVLLFTFVGLNSYLFVKFLCIPFLKLKPFSDTSAPHATVYPFAKAFSTVAIKSSNATLYESPQL